LDCNQYPSNFDVLRIICDLRWILTNGLDDFRYSNTETSLIPRADVVCS